MTSSKKPAEAQVWRMRIGEPYDTWDEKLEAFYDGELTSHLGIIEVPKTNAIWCAVLLQRGYRWENGEAPDDWTM